MVRWVNYHLKKAGQRAKVSNLSHDLSDSIALLHVLNSIDAEKCPVDNIEELEEDEELAQKLVANLAALGVPDIVQTRQLVKGNAKVNTLLCAMIVLSCVSLRGYKVAVVGSPCEAVPVDIQLSGYGMGIATQARGQTARSCTSVVLHRAQCRSIR